MPLGLSGAVDSLGLLQGKNLLLIDMDRCTRCDLCVDACVASHSDGASRLFREGSRFGKYQVPTSCRLCRDPLCMVGCPVGSIQMGGDGQIAIEDHCVGCGVCAAQCPFGSIQLEDRSALAGVGGAGDDGKKAVVCDQCSSLTRGEESCVYVCPHDAAMRVDGVEVFKNMAVDPNAAPAAKPKRPAGVTNLLAFEES
jgi:Fe-S-cluster-containing hydrogenase component 2